MYTYSPPTVGSRRSLICVLARPWVLSLALLCASLGPSSVKAQESAPLVAKIEMKLVLNDEVLDVIEKGDLLTLLSERENSFVIQTFNGQKGAVSKANVVPLAEAVAVYDALIAQDPDNGRLYTLRATSHWAAGDATSALEDFGEAIERGYDEPHAFSSRGMFNAATGHPEKALEDFSAAIDKDATDEIAFINRAGVYMSLGKHAEAIADYTRASKLAPKNPVIFMQRAVAYKLQGDIDAAIDDYTETLALADRDVAAWMGRGFLYFQQAQHELAIQDFSRAIELAPESAVAYNNRGFNRQQLGNQTEALADYEKAIELAPQYLLAIRNMGWLLATADDADLRDASKAIETAKRLCELTKFEDANDLALLAASHAAAGDFEAAIGWQEKVIARATEEQRAVGERILELYRDERPIDVRLLEPDAVRPPSPRTTRPAD